MSTEVIVPDLTSLYLHGYTLNPLDVDRFPHFYLVEVVGNYAPVVRIHQPGYKWTTKHPSDFQRAKWYAFPTLGNASEFASLYLQSAVARHRKIIRDLELNATALKHWEETLIQEQDKDQEEEEEDQNV